MLLPWLPVFTNGVPCEPARRCPRTIFTGGEQAKIQQTYHITKAFPKSRAAVHSPIKKDCKKSHSLSFSLS